MIVPQFRIQTLPSKSFQIHHSFITLPSDAIDGVANYSYKTSLYNLSPADSQRKYSFPRFLTKQRFQTTVLVVIATYDANESCLLCSHQSALQRSAS
jgi:hypothetical protein